MSASRQQQFNAPPLLPPHPLAPRREKTWDLLPLFILRHLSLPRREKSWELLPTLHPLLLLAGMLTF